MEEYIAKFSGKTSSNTYRPVLTVLPEKFTPKDKIPFWLIGALYLEVQLEMNKAHSYDDVKICKDEAKKRAKEIALRHGISHLIDWDSFLFT